MINDLTAESQTTNSAEAYLEQACSKGSEHLVRVQVKIKRKKQHKYKALIFVYACYIIG